jgi:hypothetical protein
MTTMAPINPADLRACRVRLTPGPAAAAHARREVRAAISAWNVAVDADVAVLLTSDLVTSAILSCWQEPAGQQTAGVRVTLGIRYAAGQLRVEAHDTGRVLPTAAEVPPDAEAGPGLALVARLSADWGSYRTPAGKVVYFTLASA